MCPAHSFRLPWTRIVATGEKFFGGVKISLDRMTFAPIK
jgi:hypothetical protein